MKKLIITISSAILLAAAITFIASAAYAFGDSHNQQRQSTSNRNYNDSYSYSKSRQYQDASSSNTIEIEGDNHILPHLPPNSAYAPAVIPTSDCLGSFSAGGQGQFLGFSLGATTQSKPCNIREFSKIFEARKQPHIAFAILCQDNIVKTAIESMGEACPTFDRNDYYVIRDVCAYPTEECKRYKRRR